MVVQAVKNKDNPEFMTSYEKIKYLGHFAVKAFLIAVFVFFFLLLIFFVCYFGDLLYNTKVGNNKLPLFGAYVIVSPSMVPTIKINDAIVVKRVKDNNLEIGDIITFSSSDPNYTGLTVTHRIVGKQISQTGDYVYRTKGDNNYLEDSALVKGNDVYGKVIFKIPKLGYIQKFLSTPFGFVFSIIIPILIAVVCNIGRVMISSQKEELEII